MLFIWGILFQIFSKLPLIEKKFENRNTLIVIIIIKLTGLLTKNTIYLVITIIQGWATQSH